MASRNISFDTLPASIRKPGRYFEFNTKLAVRTLSTNLQKTLIIGAKTNEGVLAPHEPVELTTDVEAAIYAGYGSEAHCMVKAAIRANPYIALTLICVEDHPASTAAVATLTLTGTAESTGVLTLGVASGRHLTAPARGDTAQEAATALALVVNQAEDCPVQAEAENGVIVFTARNKGLNGNRIALELSHTVSGLTASLTPMTGGQTNPDIREALAAVFAVGHTVVISPYTDPDNARTLRDHLDATGHALEQRGAVGVLATTATLAQATTLATSLNGGRVTLALLPGTVSLPCELAAAYGAVIAAEEDPAMPLNGLSLAGIAIPPMDKRLGRVEQENALHNGVTPLEVGPGDLVQIVRAISTYTRNTMGVEDVALLDITTIRTLDYVRKACRERISLRFPRTKLSSRTPARVRSELLDVLIKLEELEIVEEVNANKEMLIVERDAQDANRLNAAIPADVVNGLHVFAGRVDLLL